MNQKLLLSILLILFVQIGFSQTTDTKSEAEKAEEFKKQSVEFLRETAQDVKNLRTLENRISFSAEIAGLMWFHDEKEARALYQITIDDFRQLLFEINTQYNALDAAEQTEQDLYSIPFFEDSSSAAMLFRKFEKAMGVRRQIALSIAEHDAQMGYDFFVSTAAAITNQQLIKMNETRDPYFEIRLIDLLAEQDIDKAIESVRKLLAKDKITEVFGLLKKIYDKDDKKGAVLAEEFISKAKAEKNEVIIYGYFRTILMTGASNLEEIKEKPDKKPLFSQNSLREIAELLGQEILKSEGMDVSTAEEYAKIIEKFAPARAQQIRLKFRNVRRNDTNENIRDTNMEVRNTRRENEIAEQQRNQQQITEDLKKLENKELPKEEREKIIKQMREIITKIKNRPQKIMALSGLATQVAVLGDRELADEIMTEAKNFAPLQPKNYQEYLSLWMLISGYAQVDAEKAFPLLDNTVMRLNETISAFIKVAEFIDINGDFIDDDEVQVGSFGGELTRGLLSELGAANSTLLALAKADFPRTKYAVSRFDRLEVRILAKMLVLRAVSGVKKTETKEQAEETN